MKIARVFVHDHTNGKMGDILDVFDPEDHPGKVLGGILEEVEVPDDFDKDTMAFSIVDHKVEYDEETQEPVYAVNQDKVDAKTAADKVTEVDGKFRDMVQELSTPIPAVFGAGTEISAVTNVITWMRMLANPSKWSGAGLVARMDVEAADSTSLFSKGDALDTDQKITDYATRLLEIVDDYGIDREKKISAFDAEKETIMNS